MTLFWVLAGSMLMLAMILILPGLLRRHTPLDMDLDTVNTEVIKAQLAELESDLEIGRLDQTQYLAARQDLERELLADLSAQSGEGGALKVRSGRWAALLLLVLIPGVTIGLYYTIGTQQIIPLLAQADATRTATPASTPTQAQAPTPGSGTPSLDELVERLALRMQDEPDNAEGWVMLGRSYTSLQRFADAAVAYAKAYRLVGDQADLLVDYVDALVMANGRAFTDQSGALLMKALDAEPDNVRALWLIGHWKNQTGDYADALRYLQRAALQLQPGSNDAQVISEQMQQIRKNLQPGERIEAVAPDAASITAAADKSITVTIALDPRVAAGAAASDTVFIFARAVSGPRMPLAIVRKQVSDLPVTVTLDDSTAMAPTMKLSNFEAVAVGARVSKSGMAMPQAGDLQGLVTPVAPGAAETVELIIDSRVP